MEKVTKPHVFFSERIIVEIEIITSTLFRGIGYDICASGRNPDAVIKPDTVIQTIIKYSCAVYPS